MAAKPRPTAIRRHLPSHNSDKERKWQIDRNRLEHWRCWNDEIVIYDDYSGDTMKLDIIMSRTFLRLLEAPATHTELTEYLAEVFDLDLDIRLDRYTALALERFHRSGLIECLPKGEPPAGKI